MVTRCQELEEHCTPVQGTHTHLVFAGDTVIDGDTGEVITGHESGTAAKRRWRVKKKRGEAAQFKWGLA